MGGAWLIWCATAVAVVGGWELAVVCLRTVMSEDRGEGASLV